mgnify:CR=1 FL=1
MSEYVITTDNNSDLPEEYLKDHGVGCMYLSYSMDGKNYTHGNFLPEHEFYEAMRNGSMPTTAQVNPENAKALLEPYLKEGKDILIGFNPKFFIDALRVIDEENVSLYMVNPKAPCFIKDDEGKFIYLILPVNFNNAAN